MLAGRNVEPDRRLVVDHDSIGADINPIRIGIAGHVEAAGSDITPAIVLVPQRCRKLEDVDRVPGHDVLEDRAVLDHLVRDRGIGSGAVASEERLTEFDLGEIGGKAQRHVLTRIAEEISEDTVALGKTGNFVEQRGRGSFLVLQKLGGKANILLPAGPVYPAQLAQPVRLLDPFAQVGISDLVFEVTQLDEVHDSNPFPRPFPGRSPAAGQRHLVGFPKTGQGPRSGNSRAQIFEARAARAMIKEPGEFGASTDRRRLAGPPSLDRIFLPLAAGGSHPKF